MLLRMVRQGYISHELSYFNSRDVRCVHCFSSVVQSIKTSEGSASYESNRIESMQWHRAVAVTLK